LLEASIESLSYEYETRRSREDRVRRVIRSRGFANEAIGALPLVQYT